ncbi:MAG: RNA 2',3'-cyclic phosphodiesterase [Thermodesulfobacteria bacterium]|nr:RNA 2',3'-cyclic phosphodiesterase [Thermodesulfobacteriota bacterium]
MARLFLAISLPVDIRERLAGIQKELAKTGADVRWVRPEGIHLTLKFLGEVPENLIDKIAEAAQEAVRESGLKALHLGVKGLGSFPPHRAPRVIWTGLSGDLKELALLQRLLEEKLAHLGFEPEKRPFVPHLTLGRVKSTRKKEALLKEISLRREEEIVPERHFVVSEIVLYRSTLHPRGAIYTPVRRLPFGN